MEATKNNDIFTKYPLYRDITNEELTLMEEKWNEWNEENYGKLTLIEKSRTFKTMEIRALNDDEMDELFDLLKLWKIAHVDWKKYEGRPEADKYYNIWNDCGKKIKEIRTRPYIDGVDKEKERINNNRKESRQKGGSNGTTSIDIKEKENGKEYHFTKMTDAIKFLNVSSKTFYKFVKGDITKLNSKYMIL